MDNNQYDEFFQNQNGKPSSSPNPVNNINSFYQPQNNQPYNPYQQPDPFQKNPYSQPQPPMPPMIQQPPIYAKPQGNGLAVSSLVLGILSLVLCFTVFLSIPCAILGITFGAVGIKKCPTKSIAIVGLSLSVSSIVLMLIFILYVSESLVGLRNFYL